MPSLCSRGGSSLHGGVIQVDAAVQAHAQYSLAVSPMVDNHKAFRRAAACLAAISHHTRLLNGPARIQKAAIALLFGQVPLEYSHTLTALEWQPMTPELRERLLALLCKVRDMRSSSLHDQLTPALGTCSISPLILVCSGCRICGRSCHKAHTGLWPGI